MNEGNVSSALDVEDASVMLVCWRGDVHGLGWCTCGLRETLVGQARVGYPGVYFAYFEVQSEVQKNRTGVYGATCAPRSPRNV